MTTLVHGRDAAERVRAASQALFGRGDLGGLDAGTLADALAELPTAQVPRGPVPVVELMERTGLAASRSAARRTITEGGAYVNNVKVDDVEATVGPDEALHGRWLLLRRGRKSLAAAELVG